MLNTLILHKHYAHGFAILYHPFGHCQNKALAPKKTVGDEVNLHKYMGLLGTMATIAKEEGLSPFWKEIIASLHRQCIYEGLKIGLYEPVRL